MSILLKLRDKLIKSSSWIDHGIDNIVSVGSDDDISAENTGPIVDSNPIKSKGKRPGFLKRISSGLGSISFNYRRLDEQMLEELEELLITSDMGFETAHRVTTNISKRRFGKKLTTDELKSLLASEIAKTLKEVAKPILFVVEKPQVILVIGVNGSGKTTTIGKLACQFKAEGKKILIAAGDTFRAAAVEQLEIWGERAQVRVLKATRSSDPAALAYESYDQACREQADLLIIDTAGRLHNRKDLMDELSKIVRVLKQKDSNAPHNTLLVLDATTGQNAITQVEVFDEIASLSGLIMTKLDGTAKGGILVALADKFKIPIHAIGIGENIDDLAPFDPEEFALALTGMDREAIDPA